MIRDRIRSGPQRLDCRHARINGQLPCLDSCRIDAAVSGAVVLVVGCVHEASSCRESNGPTSNHRLRSSDAFTNGSSAGAGSAYPGMMADPKTRATVEDESDDAKAFGAKLQEWLANRKTQRK